MMHHRMSEDAVKVSRPASSRSGQVVALCVGASLVFGISGAASAQPSDPAPPPSGKQLFEEGVRLMAEGRNAEACPKFEAARNIDPTKIGLLLQLASCYEAAGKVASARAGYEQAEAAAILAKDRRATDAHKKSATLAPRVPKLLVTVAAEARELRDLVIELDGHPTTATMWGVLVPVDPGTHVVTASASDKKRWSGSVDVAEGATAAIEVPGLEDAIAPAPAPPSAPVPPPLPQPASPPPAPLPRIQPPPEPVVPVDVQTPQWSAQKTGGVVLMGLGGAGAVAGVVWAVLAHQQSGVLDATCPSHVGCAPGLAQAVSQHRTYSTAEVVAFAAASVAIGTGVVVYLTAPTALTAPVRPGAGVTARIGIGYAGIEGDF